MHSGAHQTSSLSRRQTWLETTRRYVRKGKFLRSMVFGGLDGLTTSTAIVCSTNGISDRPNEAISQMALGTSMLFAFGLANLVADGFSMGMGDLLSTLAEIDQKLVSDSKRDALEKDRANDWGIRNTTEREDDDDDDDDDETKLTAVLNGAAMFLSFVCFGAVPLLAYAPPLAQLWSGREEWRFRASCLSCVASLFILGALKGFVVSGKGGYGAWRSYIRTGVAMAVTGSVASLLSFFISVLAHSFFVTV
jgi:VIT1/CCC1 family predicted Fe2+/Mn2+ transporter